MSYFCESRFFLSGIKFLDQTFGNWMTWLQPWRNRNSQKWPIYVNKMVHFDIKPRIFPLKFWIISKKIWWKRWKIFLWHRNFLYAGVQGKNNAYHNVNKVQNSYIDALILNLIGIVVCVVFALYSSIIVNKANFKYRQSGWLCTRWGEIAQSLNFKYLYKSHCKSRELL